MTQRTVDIIAICKGLTNKYNKVSDRQNIIDYITTTQNIDINTYEDWKVDWVIEDAFFDFLDSTDTPSQFIRAVFFSNNQTASRMSLCTNIITAFKNVVVTSDNKYCNGFTNSLIDVSIKNLDITKDFN